MDAAMMEKMARLAHGTLTDHLGFELLSAEDGRITAAFDGTAMNRPGPRLADATRVLGERIDEARKRDNEQR